MAAYNQNSHEMNQPAKQHHIHIVNDDGDGDGDKDEWVIKYIFEKHMRVSIYWLYFGKHIGWLAG